MNATRLLADTDFRVEAAQVLDEFVRDHGCPVKRAQIAGLRQIAMNEPGKVLEFANHQRDREQKRGGSDDRIAFWKLVGRLCGAAGFDPNLWSLDRFAERKAPDDCKPGKRPHGSASPAEHKAYRDAKARADGWHDAWQRANYPSFFQRFCAHYLYLMANPFNDDRRNDS